MTVDIYVDGSYIGGKTKWACIGVEGDKELFRERGVLEGDICSMRQVGGELKAAVQAIAYCRKHGKRARIFYDYKGIACWTGLVPERWEAKNEWTKKYSQFVRTNKAHVAEFVKVKGHSGDRWNDACDEFAKGA